MIDNFLTFLLNASLLTETPKQNYGWQTDRQTDIHDIQQYHVDLSWYKADQNLKQTFTWQMVKGMHQSHFFPFSLHNNTRCWSTSDILTVNKPTLYKHHVIKKVKNTSGAGWKTKCVVYLMQFNYHSGSWHLYFSGLLKLDRIDPVSIIAVYLYIPSHFYFKIVCFKLLRT